MNGQTTTAGCQTPVVSIQSEIDRVFQNLAQIEEKLFIPEPKESVTNEKYDANKLVILKNDIYQVANRLEIINKALEIIGK